MSLNTFWNEHLSFSMGFWRLWKKQQPEGNTSCWQSGDQSLQCAPDEFGNLPPHEVHLGGRRVAGECADVFVSLEKKLQEKKQENPQIFLVL